MKLFATGDGSLYLAIMKTVEEIEHEIQELPVPDVARLSAWLSEYDGKVWDRQMDEDAASGKLDSLFEESEKERKAGKLRIWPSPQDKA